MELLRVLGLKEKGGTLLNDLHGIATNGNILEQENTVGHNKDSIKRPETQN